MKNTNLCGFTKKDKEYFMEKHNAILQEILFTENDCPPNNKPEYVGCGYGIGCLNEEKVIIPTFYFNKKGEVIPNKLEHTKALPSKKAIIKQVEGACEAGRYYYASPINERDPYDSLSDEKKEIPKSQQIYVYVIRSIFDKEAVGIMTTPSPVKYKMAIGGTEI